MDSAAESFQCRLKHDRSDKEVFALLIAEPGESISLRIEHFDDNSPEWLSRDVLARLDVLHPEHWTLFGLQRGRFSVGTRGTLIEFHASTAVRGEIVQGVGPMTKEIGVYFSGLRNWIQTSGLSYSDLAPGSKLKFEYESPGPFQLNPRTGLQAELLVAMSLNQDWSAEERLRLKERPYLCLTTSEPEQVKGMIRDASKIVGLFELLCGNPFGIESVELHREDEEALQFIAKFPKPQSQKYSLTRELFSYQLTTDWLNDALQHWFQLYEEVPFALDLVRALRHGNYGGPDVGLFGAVSALDALHATLVGGNKGSSNLEGRLSEIAKKYAHAIGPLLKPSDCKTVADGRNHIAHPLPKNRQKALPPSEVFLWYRRISMTLDAILIASLPIPDALHENICTTRLRRISTGIWGDLIA